MQGVFLRRSIFSRFGVAVYTQKGAPRGAPFSIQFASAAGVFFSRQRKAARATAAAPLRIFAVFHMNFTQLFFTFFCGLVWGWVYCRSGKFWHVCFLHIAYNTVYGLLLPYLTEWSTVAQEQIFSVSGALKPAEILPFLGNLLIIAAWVLVLTVTVALAVLGVIALSRTLPKLKLEKSELSLTRKETLRAVFSASGFIAMLLVLAIYFVSRVTGAEVLSLLLYR